jgi:hypothetical protein
MQEIKSRPFRSARDTKVGTATDFVIKSNEFNYFPAFSYLSFVLELLKLFKLVQLKLITNFNKLNNTYSYEFMVRAQQGSCSVGKYN